MWKKEKAENTGAEELTQEPMPSSTGNQGGEDVIAFVGRGVEFKGVITYNGTVRIDGQMEGEIHTEGTLIIGDEAVIKAKVSAGTIICKGRITGDVVAKEKVKLLAPAALDGSVKTPMLSMEEGVLFNGSCEMVHPDVRELPLETALPREVVMRAIHHPSPSGVKRISG